jgi:hypothetical protein
MITSTIALQLVVSKTQSLFANGQVLGFNFMDVTDKRSYFE